MTDKRVLDTLQSGGVVVLRTDTLYGLVARADNQEAVEAVYRLKGRDEQKSPIVLIAEPDQMFDRIDSQYQTITDSYWPGRVSIIMPSLASPAWISRANNSVAYRIPDHDELRALLRQTGPLVAPSANPQGRTPAQTIEQAIKYFGAAVDVYVDGGRVVDSSPSTLLAIAVNGQVERLR